jgi:hypothetical protein
MSYVFCFIYVILQPNNVKRGEKKNAQFRRAAPHIVKELLANRRQGRSKRGVDFTSGLRKAFGEAYLKGETKLVEEKDPYFEAAKKLRKCDLIRLLKAAYPDSNGLHARINKTCKNTKDTHPENYVNLVDMYAHYLSDQDNQWEDVDDGEVVNVLEGTWGREEGEEDNEDNED